MGGGIQLVETDRQELALVVELLSGGDAIIVGLRDDADTLEALRATVKVAEMLGHHSLIVDVANAQVRPARVIRVTQEGAVT